MNTKEYDQKKQECWEEYFKHVVCGTDSHEYWFNKIFDCAFALGKEKETITQEEIEKAAKKYAAEVDKNVRDLYGIENLPVSLTFGECAAESFREGVSFALGKQEKDVVGEEMLTVPRKKVLYMYDFNEDILICDPTHNGAKLLKAKLQELFGSKCLPDEACNVASSDVASSKPKPTEPKFKRCKKVITPSGEVCIIEDTHFENGCWLCLVGDPARWIPESDLEPYTEPDTSHETPVCESHSGNTSQKEVNMNSNCNLLKDCDKQFDNILKDSFSKERRLNIAVQMVKAITQCPEIIERIASAEADSLLDDIVDDALHLTDRLISKCEKGGEE